MYQMNDRSIWLNIYDIFTISAELGDFNPEEHTPGYLSEFRFIPGQSEDFEKEVAELHKSHRSARMK